MNLYPNYILTKKQSSNKINQKSIVSQQKVNFCFYRIFLLASTLYFFPSHLFAQNCPSEQTLLIETSLLTGQVCEGSVANVSVDVTSESFFALNEIDSIQWFWYVDLPCLLYTSPSPRDATLSRMPSSA